MKKTLTVLIVCLFVASLAWAQNQSTPSPAPEKAMAEAHSAKQHEFIQNREEIRWQMNNMLNTMSELDIIVHRGRMFDNDLTQNQAQLILATIEKIRALDPQKIFQADLDKLQKTTQQLLQAARVGEPGLGTLSDELFQACFACHQKNRKK